MAALQIPAIGSDRGPELVMSFAAIDSPGPPGDSQDRRPQSRADDPPGDEHLRGRARARLRGRPRARRRRRTWRRCAAGQDRGGIAGVLLTHSHADHSAGAPCSEPLCCSVRSGRPMRPRASGRTRGQADPVDGEPGARWAVRGHAHARARDRSRLLPVREGRPLRGPRARARARASSPLTVARWPPTSTRWSACGRRPRAALARATGPGSRIRPRGSTSTWSTA